MHERTTHRVAAGLFACCLAAGPIAVFAQTGEPAPSGARETTPQQAAGSPPPASAFDAFLAGTTFGIDLDGYYEDNANDPVGRVNLLRAYDVTSNSFSLNQVGFVIDHAPDPSQGHRAGLRVDLMYGQATETLQGSAANEPRPQVYRPLFQAYGSYVFPLGHGLQVDFGKFASALGIEGNYTKDQMNYSRSFFFNFLPFYHMGFRTTYTVNDRIALTWWLVNGAQQTEDFNGFKSQAAIVTLTPVKSVSWNVNYYTGKEGRDLVPLLNPGLPTLPTQPGLSTTPNAAPDQGRTDIFDTYATWSATSRLTLAVEGDYYTIREPLGVSPTLSGGAAYVQYRPRADVQLAARTEYMNDRNGLFSNLAQHLHEATGTLSWLPGPGYLVRLEWRRDWSNRPFFPGNAVDVRKTAQSTLTLGMVWWFGNKEGGW
ncbi:MAG TPA: outer membrane beta-barrel protein [Vicinamibacterales bacterium]|nr:outer membrane beta-barrel protein [Vicinamibacterales bacterium]